VQAEGSSLPRKVGLAMAGFMAVVAGGAGFIADRQMSEMAYQDAYHHGRAVLDALAIPAAVAIATSDYAKLDNFVAELERAEGGEILELFVVDGDGRLMATSATGLVGARARPHRGRASVSSEFIARALAAKDVWFAFGPDPRSPEVLDIAKPIEQGQRWGTIIARFSLADSGRALTRLERYTAVITVLAAVLGWAISFAFLSKLVITPARRLAELAAELERANKELAELATTDGLTGLRNHRFFRTTLDFEIKRGARTVHQLCLLMLDVDHFKSFNDTHGHPAGDEVLRKVGRLLAANLRGTDLVARYGGEEFAVILLDTAADEGLRTAEKLSELFRREPFEGEHTQPSGKLTVSIGLAAFPEDAATPERLIRNADLALYEAKRRGRNTVVRFWDEIPQHTGQSAECAPADPPTASAEAKR
jgi:diguanylate cyclase (GGDEF)-like protein